MSSFGGRMKEYERISLDRFDGKNLQSTVYFLSHLHEDHTVGLAEPLLYKRLKSNKNIFLYCSEVTEVLLCASKKYRHLAPYIKSIPINTPTTVEVPDPLFDERETVTITLLPAFHCPGSVMCLFEGHEGNVIYTGDFRWEHFDIEQMHYLRSGERVKEVQSLYVDTTFCTPDNLFIPSRQQCIDAVYQLVQEWIAQGPDYAVYLNLRAQYGHEPLINSLAIKLNKKVHVNDSKAAVYDRIQEFHNNFTADGTSTQLHACDKQCTVEVDGERIPCRQQYSGEKVLSILPTTMYFTQFQHLTLDKVIRRMSDNFYRACYSFHSSYTEIKDLLSYLQPANVYPNVKPPADETIAVTQHRLNLMLKECKESGDGGDLGTKNVKVKKLGTLKTRSSERKSKRKKSVSVSDSESLDFGTPGKKLKQLKEAKSESTVTTRRSSKRLAASQEVIETQQTTPKKSKRGRKKSDSPDLFVTPVKSEKSDISVHSSYAGSQHGSEIDLTSSLESQSILSLDPSKEDQPECSWSLGSFLSAVNSSSLEDTSCIVIEEDMEQTDENFEDNPIIIDDADEDENVEEKTGEEINRKDSAGTECAESGVNEQTSGKTRKGGRNCKKRKGRPKAVKRKAEDHLDMDTSNTKDSSIDGQSIKEDKETEFKEDTDVSRPHTASESQCSKISSKIADDGISGLDKEPTCNARVDTDNEATSDSDKEPTCYARVDTDSEATSDSGHKNAETHEGKECSHNSREKRKCEKNDLPFYNEKTGIIIQDDDKDLDQTDEKTVENNESDSDGAMSLIVIDELEIDSDVDLDESTVTITVDQSKAIGSSSKNVKPSDYSKIETAAAGNGYGTVPFSETEESVIDVQTYIQSDSGPEVINKSKLLFETENSDRGCESDRNGYQRNHEISNMGSNDTKKMSQAHETFSTESDLERKFKNRNKLNADNLTTDSFQEEPVEPSSDNSLYQKSDDDNMKQQVMVKRIRFTRSRSFDMLDANEDNSDFGFVNEVNEKDLPDKSIYFDKLAYCFESTSQVEKTENTDKAENFLKEKTKSDSDAEPACKSDSKASFVEEEVIDLTGEDETVPDNKDLKIDANINYKTKDGRKLMTISFSKRPEKIGSLKRDKKKEKDVKCAESQSTGAIKVANEDSSDLCGVSDSNAKDTEDVSGSKNHLKDIKELNTENVTVDGSTVKNTSIEENSGQKQLPGQDVTSDEMKDGEDLDKDVQSNNDTSEMGEISKVDEKDEEERKEIQRQAYGFMIETDSDTDSDSTQGPGSPTGSVLYDEYVELSSGDDENSEAKDEPLNKMESESGTDDTSTPDKDVHFVDEAVGTVDEPNASTLDDDTHIESESIGRSDGDKTSVLDEDLHVGDKSHSRSVRVEKSNFKQANKGKFDNKDSGWLSAKRRKHIRKRRENSSSDEDMEYSYKRGQRYRQRASKFYQRGGTRERPDNSNQCVDLFHRYRRNISVNIQQHKGHYGNIQQANQRQTGKEAYRQSSKSVRQPSVVSTSGMVGGTNVNPPFVPSPFSVPPPTYGFPLSGPAFPPPPIGFPPPTGIFPPLTGVAPPLPGTAPQFGGPLATPVPLSVAYTCQATSNSSTTSSTVVSSLSKTTSSTSTLSSAGSNLSQSSVQEAALALASASSPFNKDISELKNKIFEVTGLKNIIETAKAATGMEQQAQNVQPAPIEQVSFSSATDDLPTLMKKLDEVKKLLQDSQVVNQKDQSDDRSRDYRDEAYDDRSQDYRNDAYDEMHLRRRHEERYEGPYEDYRIYEDRRRRVDDREFRGREDSRYWDEDVRRYKDRYRYEDRSAPRRSSYDPYDGMPPPHPSDPYYEEWMDYFRERQYRHETKEYDRMEREYSRRSRYNDPPPERNYERSLYAEPPVDHRVPPAYRGRPPPIQYSQSHGRPQQGQGHSLPARSHHPENSTASFNPVSPAMQKRFEPRTPGNAQSPLNSHTSVRRPKISRPNILSSFHGNSQARVQNPIVRVRSRSGKLSVTNEVLSAPEGSTVQGANVAQTVRKDELPVFLTGLQS